ncbi:glycosyltransferase family 10 domain-containing protein [Mucilaginibacter pedocola]|uniref:Uncharacterized protein n=1 Tax=Mucilaginibacter pedocola TaxID=1792845 RepID=A0A1S9PAU2_9SPHI|nr:glycosyltransferase family 10 [Mucilaginibacter pedocola]OOQ58080.1 hypothetical protein BC343_10500 [Mucilaginibacter pedocola]
MSNKPALKINFTGFWASLNKTDNFFYNLLAKNYRIEISEEPDLLFYSVGGTDHTKYRCTKIYYTGENEKPNFMLCDFAFSYGYNTPRNYRLPLYALYHDVKKLTHRTIDTEKILAEKNGFCCFLVTNGKCATRNDFFEALSKYKKVDSGGQFRNNIGYVVDDKHEFIRKYKFVIAFENTSYPGYTTEKIYEPFIQHCVPIYWGDPNVDRDFNTKAFINSADFTSFDKVIEHVIAVDNDDELYKQYLREPVFTNDEVNEYVNEDNILKRLDEIVAYHFNRKRKLRQMVRPTYYRLILAADAVNAKLRRLAAIPAGMLMRLTNKKQSG